MAQLLEWTLDLQRFALPLNAVDRVLRAVALTPLPDAPALILGIINVQGEVVPVIDMRRRLLLAPRAIALTDQLVLAHTAHQLVAFFAETVSTIAHFPDDAIVSTDLVLPGSGCMVGIVKLPDGMVLIHDLDLFLSIEDARALELALAHAQ